MSKGLRWATWFLSNPITYDYVESHPIDIHIKPLRFKKKQKYFSMLKIFEIKKCKQTMYQLVFLVMLMFILIHMYAIMEQKSKHQECNVRVQRPMDI